MTTKIIIKKLKKELERLSQNGTKPKSIFIKGEKIAFSYHDGTHSAAELSGELDSLKNTLQTFLSAQFVSLFIETPLHGDIAFRLEYTRNGTSDVLTQKIKA